MFKSNTDIHKMQIFYIINDFHVVAFTTSTYMSIFVNVVVPVLFRFS